MVRAATAAHDLFLRRRLVMEARVLKLSDEQSAAVATSYDLAMLCTATQTILTQKLPDQKSRIKALFEACRSLNVTRVRVPHGTWIDDGTTLAARHISRNALSTKHYFAHTDEPRKLTEKARCPMTDLRHDAAPGCS